MEEKTLEEIKKECSGCMKCPLGKTRTNLVFGIGNPNSRLMFVGEAPGQNEDLSGIPFVGAAGKLFDKYLGAVGIDRNDVYITNILKCRPPQNRDPSPEEQDTCIDWLRAQTAILKPRVIVCLGRIAACRIISPDFRVTRQHGVFTERNGVWLMGTFHPAALLRNPAQKPEAFADFLALRDRLQEWNI